MKLVPRVPEKQLFGYQEFGANWIASRERAGLLDRPRVGKTPQTIRALDVRRAVRGIGICPAHVKKNWFREFRVFGCYERRVCLGNTIHDLVAWKRGIFDVLLLSYEMAQRWAPRIHDHAEILDFVFLDEFHMLSNLKTKRAEAILGPNGDGQGGIVQWAAQAWALTGTLMRNDPSNCFAFLKFVGATDMPQATFIRRYFHARPTTWGQRCRPREDRIDELRRLIEDNSISRTLAQVGHEVPPIFYTEVLVDGDTTAICELLVAHPGLDAAIIAAVEKGGLSFLDAQHVATMRKLVAEAKALPYIEMLLQELLQDPEQKVVIGGFSYAPLRMIHDVLNKRGIGCVAFQGGVSSRQKDANELRFRDDPLCQAAVVNYTSGGTGINLSAANWVDVFESSWVPSDIDQMIKRIQGFTQTRTQRARFIALANSTDETVTSNVREKAQNIAMIDNEPMVAAPPVEAA